MGFLHHWQDLCRAMERPDLTEDPKYINDQMRLSRRDEVVEMVESWLKTFPDVGSAEARLDAFNVPCAPILSVEETVSHPHFIARGTVRTVNDRLAGEFEIPGMPIKFMGEEANQPFEAPTLGQHNAEILRSVLGKNEEEINELTQGGILFSKEV